ncbi:MAG: glyceraldehyde 3-phosphate dehydrogenase NAD-binding domain-containing protein, partial [Acidimicrobiales bacterium]
MTIRVGINGFGRIGRLYLRAALGHPEIEVVAINDLASPETNAHLLAYDSTHGKLNRPVSISDGAMNVGDQRVAVLAERDPGKLPWRDLGVDVVIESTGRFTSRDAAAVHLVAGASRVIISAPSGDADASFVVGVN